MPVCFFSSRLFYHLEPLSLFAYTTVSVRSNYGKNTELNLVYQRAELNTPGLILTAIQFSYLTFTISDTNSLHQCHARRRARAGNLSGLLETQVTIYIFICFSVRACAV